MQTASKDVDARALCADAANAVRGWPRAARSAAAPLPPWARLVKKKNAQARARARCGRAQGRAQRESVRERVLERRGSQEADVCHPRLRRSQRALTAALLSSRWRARARARALATISAQLQTAKNSGHALVTPPARPPARGRAPPHSIPPHPPTHTRRGALADLQVLDYCADGFDALEECLKRELPADKVPLVALGVDALFSRLERAAHESLAGFERAAVSECFSLPPSVTEAEGGDAAAASGSGEGEGAKREVYSAQSEAELQAELATLRQRIAAVHGACAAKQRKAERVEAELAAYADKGASLHAVAGAGKENFAQLQEDTSAVVQAADKLIPLLERSCELGATDKVGKVGKAGKAGRTLPPRGLSARNSNVGASLEHDFARRQKELDGASAKSLEAINAVLRQGGEGAPASEEH